MSKIFVFLSATMLLVFGSLTIVLAQSINTELTADFVSVEKNGVIVASGNVELKQAGKSLKAKSVKILPDENEIIVENISEFRFSEQGIISASEGKFDTNLKSGLVNSASFLLDDLISINANKIAFSNGQLRRADGIWRVTSCRTCKHEQPLWHFSASSAERDEKNSNQIYKNIKLYFKGIPFGFFPYLRLPDPSIRRAQGFLNPSIELTSNLGSGIKLPYFIPIGRSKDILITPYISPNTTTLEYRYRQVLKSGNLLVTGSISNDILTEKTFRNYIRAQGNLSLNYGIGLSVDIGHVNDNAYLGDYLYSDYSDFDTNVTIAKTLLNKSSFLDGRFTYTRDIEQGQVLNKYITTSFDYRRNINTNIPKGHLDLGLYLSSSATFDKNDNLSRPPSSSEISANFSNTENFGYFLVQKSVFGDIISLVNADNDAQIDEQRSFKTGALINFSLPFSKQGNNRTQYVKPQVQISYKNQTSDLNGKFFKSTDELNRTNIFLGKKIVSLSESELGFGVSSGLEYISKWQSGQKFTGFLGFSQIGNASYNPDSFSGLDLKTKNYLINFSYLAPKYFSVNGSSRFTDNGYLSISNLKSTFSTNKFSFSGDYEYVNKNTDHRLLEHLENINLVSSFSPLEGTTLTASGRYDLELRKMAGNLIGINTSRGQWNYNFSHNFIKEEKDKLSLSAVYDDECTTVIFSFENRFQGVGGSTPIRTFGFKVNFKQFTNFEFSR